MPLAQFGFLLPENVRSDVGFQASVRLVSVAASAGFVRKIPGQFFEVVASVQVDLSTDATAITRTVQCRATDGDGNLVFVADPALTQGASSLFGYRWALTISTAFSPGAGLSAAPLFPFVFPSGWQFRIIVVNAQVGDQLQNISLVLQQYETGLLAIPTTRRAGIAEGVIGSVSVGGSGELVSVVPSAPAPTPSAPALAPSAPAPAGTQYPAYTAPAPAPAQYIPLPSAPAPSYIPIPPDLYSTPTPTPTFEPQ